VAEDVVAPRPVIDLLHQLLPDLPERRRRREPKVSLAKKKAGRATPGLEIGDIRLQEYPINRSAGQRGVIADQSSIIHLGHLLVSQLGG
jgi:hypothetical protein